MLDAGLDRHHRPNARLAKALDTMFLLHAEHEMNCSTAAARHLASSGVDVYSAVAGAVGALYGPLHGGANEGKYFPITMLRLPDCPYKTDISFTISGGQNR